MVPCMAQVDPVGYIAFLYPKGYISTIYPKGDINELRSTHAQAAWTDTQRTATIAAPDAEKGGPRRRSSAQNDIEIGARHRDRDH